MAMFVGHVAFMLELAVFVAGLALWHFGRERAASTLRAGALIAMVGSALSALCTGYYLVRYSVQGDVDHAYPIYPGMAREMMEHGGMMGSGRMMGGRMMEGMRERRGEGPPAPEEPPAPPGHEEHHPGKAAE